MCLCAKKWTAKKHTLNIHSKSLTTLNIAVTNNRKVLKLHTQVLFLSMERCVYWGQHIARSRAVESEWTHKREGRATLSADGGRHPTSSRGLNKAMSRVSRVSQISLHSKHLKRPSLLSNSLGSFCSRSTAAIYIYIYVYRTHAKARSLVDLGLGVFSSASTRLTLHCSGPDWWDLIGERG